MDAELAAAFEEEQIFQGLFRLRDIMRILYHMASRPEPISRSDFEPIQDCLAAQRRVMITRMIGEMRFFSRKETREALRILEPRTRLPPGVTPPAEEEEIL